MWTQPGIFPGKPYLRSHLVPNRLRQVKLSSPIELAHRLDSTRLNRDIIYLVVAAAGETEVKNG